MTGLRITHWRPIHETYECRKVDFMNWVAVPNKHDGLSFSHLRAEADRVELYCAWTLMLQLAAKAPKHMRGWLVRSGRPLETREMALMTGFPEVIFQKAVQYFQQPEVGWLTVEELPAQTPDLPARTARTAARPAELAAESAADAAGPLIQTGREGGRTVQTDSTDRQGEREKVRSPVFEVPTLKEVQERAAALNSRPDRDLPSIPADYAAHYWRRKQEKPASWFDSKNGRLMEWATQLENWWREDHADWASKKTGGSADTSSLEQQLVDEKNPAARRALRDKIREAV